MQTQRRSWTEVQQYNVVNFVVSACLSFGFGVGIIGGAPHVQWDIAHTRMPIESVTAGSESACAWNDRVYVYSNSVVGDEQIASVAAYYGLTVDHLMAYNHLTLSGAPSVNQRICIPGDVLQPSSGMDSSDSRNGSNDGTAAVDSVSVRLAAPFALARSASLRIERREKPAAPAFQSVSAALGSTHNSSSKAPGGFLLHSVLAVAAGAFNAFPFGQCTWWATQRYYQLHNVFVPWSFNANAGEWVDRARQYRWHVSSIPTIGAILVLQGGVQGAGSIGHVGIVEQVNDDGSVIASSMNWGGHPGIITHSQFYTGSGVTFISQ